MNPPSLSPESQPGAPSSGDGRSLTAPAARMDSARLLQLILGRESVMAGSFPPDAAFRPQRAEALRSLDMHFTTAQKVASGEARAERLASSRWALAAVVVSALLVGAAAGGAGGWWIYSPDAHAGAPAMPHASWRIQAVTPDAVVVRAAGRLWPIRVGQELPNGDRVVMVDDKSRSVVTETGSFQLVAPAPEASQDTRKN